MNKSARVFLFFILGAGISLMNGFAPVHEYGHILKSAEYGGKVLWLEWARVSLTVCNYQVYMNGYWYELMSAGILVVVLGWIGTLYFPRLPIWAIFFGSMHGCWYRGLNGQDFFDAAQLSGQPYSIVVGYWQTVCLAVIVLLWIVYLSIVFASYMRNKKTGPIARPVNVRAFRTTSL